MNTRTGKFTRFLALVLVCVMILGVCPVMAIDPTPSPEPVIDTVVAESIYGWVTTKAAANDDKSEVTITIMPAGKTETATYTMSIDDEVVNALANVQSAADVITARCNKVGMFVEICLNQAGEVIDMRRVLQAGVFFDTAEFGGDLTAIGSTVEKRGLDYVSNKGQDIPESGPTGIATGLSGDMVASGWVLDKGSNTITLGDGNEVTEVFIEQYDVAEDVKVYEVANTDNYASTASTFEAVPVTPKTQDANGNTNIYNTASDDRKFAIVVFDGNYEDYGTAKVKEIYYFTAAAGKVTVNQIPQSTRIGSDLSESTQGSPKPGAANNHLTSATPFTVVDGKMWSTGDIEALTYLFYAENGNDYSLVRYDTGWPASGYQYWKNDQKALEELGLTSRDITRVLLSHGHSDHYGTSFDLWEMIVRAGNSAEVFETYEDGVGYDTYGFPETKGALPVGEYAFRSIITNWYEMDQWLELGDGLSCYPILTPGHTPGVASCVYQVTVGEGGMKDAHLVYNDETGERTITDYNEGDELFFVYMGGYGINGLNNPSKGYLRPAFISSLRYLESVLPNLKTSTGEKADGVYNLPQHTNQFPYMEVNCLRDIYNEKNGTGYEFLHFLREGTDEIINFCEKRASALLYEEYDAKYQKMYDDAGKTVPYMTIDGIEVKIDATNANPANLHTVEAAGPYKHEAGEAVIQIDEDIEIITMHGYDPFLNKGGVAEEDGLMNIASQGGSAKSNFNMSKGFLFAKDGFVTDPDAWYVQIGAHVMDDYDGNVYSDTGINAGSTFTSGPVESFHGEGWSEIIRTGAMTKAEAEALAATLENGAYYKVNLMKTGDIVNAENIMDTFVPASVEDAYEAGYAKTLPNAEDITVDLDDYYGQKIQGYYNFECIVSTGADKTAGTADDTVRTAKFYIPEGTVFNQPTVFVGVPNGVNTYKFMVDSGWKALADEKKLHIVMMEPENKTWGDEADEIAYIAALNEDVSYRPFFCAFSSNFYGIGYGECADLLQKHSVDNPKSWAAIAVLGATGMTAEKVTELQNTDSKVPGVSKAEVQTPIWIVPAADANADSIANLVGFYKSANHSANTAAGTSDYAEEVYLPVEGGTVDDEWCANVAYDKDTYTADMVAKAYSEAIYTELFEGTYRYPGNANGALRRPGEIFSRGFTYHEAKVDGYNREWYVYEPESAKAKEANGEQVPLVFVFHGAGGSGNEIADRSGWATVAEEKGFIIVMPTGSIQPSVRNVSNITTNEYFRAMWNTGDATATRPSDLAFVEYLHDWMLKNYKIDATRVYASGQSSGGMMTWACAAKLPELFAAAAPISAYNSPDPIGTSLIPVACYIGEAETTFRNGFTDKGGKKVIDTYTDLYNTVERWSTYTYMEDDTRAPEKEGLFTKYLYNTSKLVPMLMAVEVETKTHAIWPSECFDAWENWFVHYTKDAKGNLYYDGQLVKLDSTTSSSSNSKPSINEDAEKSEKPAETGLPFTDVNGHWAKDAIKYVYENQIMNGVSATKFAPNDSTTRGMIVTMLYRLAGTPAVSGACTFTDVKSGSYYEDAVIWAAANGIVKGVSETSFAPDVRITREQLATMLYNYAVFAKYDVTGSAELGSFADAAQVSSWAQNGLKWAVADKLVNGVGGNNLDPTGDATRAQVATIFQRFMEGIAK